MKKAKLQTFGFAMQSHFTDGIRSDASIVFSEEFRELGKKTAKLIVEDILSKYDIEVRKIITNKDSRPLVSVHWVPKQGAK